MTPATARLLVGRTIVAFELNPFDDGRGGKAYNPVITLDSLDGGAAIAFTVMETDVDVYGIKPTYYPRGLVPR